MWHALGRTPRVLHYIHSIKSAHTKLSWIIMTWQCWLFYQFAADWARTALDYFIHDFTCLGRCDIGPHLDLILRNKSCIQLTLALKTDTEPELEVLEGTGFKFNFSFNRLDSGKETGLADENWRWPEVEVEVNKTSSSTSMTEKGSRH